jgi:hypothetical protein
MRLIEQTLADPIGWAFVVIALCLCVALARRM